MTHALPVVVIAYSGAGYDNSITSLSGVSEQALPSRNNRRYLYIENPSVMGEVGVNVTGGVAVIGGRGTMRIPAGGFREFITWVPNGAINVIGVAGQGLIVIEG